MWGLWGYWRYDAAVVCSFAGEIDEQGEFKVRCFEIRSHLRVVRLAQVFDCLELEDHPPFHKKVQTMPADLPTIVINDNFLFDFRDELLFSKLDEQRTPVDYLQEPGSERLMHADNTGNDLSGEVIVRTYLHIPPIPLSPFPGMFG